MTKKRLDNPHAELCAWANGLRPDSPQNMSEQAPSKELTAVAWLVKWTEGQSKCSRSFTSYDSAIGMAAYLTKEGISDRAVVPLYEHPTHEPRPDLLALLARCEPCIAALTPTGSAHGSMQSLLADVRAATGEQEPSLPEVGGETLPTSLADFERACKTHLAEEQAKISPDNALIGTLCNAVRLARENERMAKSALVQPPLPLYKDGALIESGGERYVLTHLGPVEDSESEHQPKRGWRIGDPLPEGMEMMPEGMKYMSTTYQFGPLRDVTVDIASIKVSDDPNIIPPGAVWEAGTRPPQFVGNRYPVDSAQPPRSDEEPVGYLRDWLKLHDAIGARLEADHNWTDEDRRAHGNEVEERRVIVEQVREFLRAYSAVTKPVGIGGQNFVKPSQECEGCPPFGYQTNKTRCDDCPRETARREVE